MRTGADAMSVASRHALLRQLSAHPHPDQPLLDHDPGPPERWGGVTGRLELDGVQAVALSQAYLALLLFAAECCSVDPKILTPLDLMAALSNLSGARPPGGTA